MENPSCPLRGGTRVFSKFQSSASADTFIVNCQLSIVNSFYILSGASKPRRSMQVSNTCLVRSIKAT